MGRLKRIWLAGALVVVVAAVAAPAGAQTSATQADWQRECVRIGGTFSITDLGGPKVVYECTGVRGFRGPPAFTNPAQELVNICDEFPDSKKSDASFAIASGIGMARCMRDGVANIKETRVLKATRLSGQQLEIQVSYNCPSRYRNHDVRVFVEVSQSTGAASSGNGVVQCTGRWVTTVIVVDGPFAVGPADVAVRGLIDGLLGDSDVSNLQIVAG